LMRFYPAAFREEYGGQMLLAFVEQLGEARRSGNPLEPAALWAHATMDAVTIAPKEHCHVILQDLRYALRTMAARPGFTAVAILSLAIGIGANTAIFSLWNGLLHSPLPVVSHPAQLVILTNPNASGSWTGTWDTRTDGPRFFLTYAEFEQLRDRSSAFSGLMASQSGLSTWRLRMAGGQPEEASGRFVSAEFFDVLGVKPFLGQFFSPFDRAAPAAVLSYRYWQQRFGASPEVRGQALVVEKTPLTIIGVAPPGFIGETSGQQPDLWLPLPIQPTLFPKTDRLHDRPPSKSMWLNVFGRLKPGVTAAQAQADANAVFRAGLEPFYGAAATGPRRDEYLDQTLRVTPAARGASAARHEFANSLTALLAAVGVLLLIACANLANLLLARGASRRHEIALRLSLGASRGRLIRQLLTESLVLAVLGGAAAFAVAYLLHAAMVRMMAESDPRFQMPFTLDPRVLAFVGAVVVGSALLFGILPAWQITKTGPAASLKEQSRGATGSLSQVRSGRYLVSLQLALALPLLVGAGLLVRTVYNLKRTDLGFPAHHLLLVRVDLREASAAIANRHSLVDELLYEFQRIPGVRAVSFSQLGIFSGGESSNSIEVEGYRPQNDRDYSSTTDVVGPRYFLSLRIPILVGREIRESDRARSPRVCVINEAFARRFFEDRNPIGMQIASVEDGRRTEYQVVGVARNARTKSLRDAIDPRYFVAGDQDPESVESPTYLIRTAVDSASIAPAARRIIARLDPALPIIDLHSIEEQMAPLTAQDRATARLAVAFGFVSLILAAIGLYGVLSYGVARRTSEIAIRMALGSDPARLIMMILRETASLVAAGLLSGVALAWAASRLIESRLYGVEPQDPATFALAAALLLAVALAAAYLPARRASKLDPMTALRQE
jgi:putative ABC transport system permease protein